MTSIAEVLGPDKVSELLTTQYTPPELLKPKRDKYIPYKEILDSNRELGEQIKRVFESSQRVPAIHITSRAFETEDGEVDSGFIQNIHNNGFRAKDTNIGVFMRRAGTRQPALPIDFVDRPEIFLRELEILIRHYYHHGTRTNKALLEGNQNIGVGIPVMLLIDVTNVSLEPGSDYEDHYKLGSIVPGSRIIGEIDLNGIGTKIVERLPEIAAKFLDLTENYLKRNSHR